MTETSEAVEAPQTSEKYESTLTYDEKFRMAAEAVLVHVRINDEPALDFINRVITLGDQIASQDPS